MSNVESEGRTSCLQQVYNIFDLAAPVLYSKFKYECMIDLKFNMSMRELVNPDMCGSVFFNTETFSFL